MNEQSAARVGKPLGVRMGGVRRGFLLADPDCIVLVPYRGGIGGFRRVGGKALPLKREQPAKHCGGYREFE